MPHCIIKNCHNNTTNKKIRFFSVPSFVKKPQIALQWTENANDSVKTFYREVTKPKPWPQRDTKLEFEEGYVRRNNPYRVCEVHFTHDCFEVDLQAKLLNNVIKKKLAVGAIPTLFNITDTSTDKTVKSFYGNEASPFITNHSNVGLQTPRAECKQEIESDEVFTPSFKRKPISVGTQTSVIFCTCGSKEEVMEKDAIIKNLKHLLDKERSKYDNFLAISSKQQLQDNLMILELEGKIGWLCKDNEELKERVKIAKEKNSIDLLEEQSQTERVNYNRDTEGSNELKVDADSPDQLDSFQDVKIKEEPFDVVEESILPHSNSK